MQYEYLKAAIIGGAAYGIAALLAGKNKKALVPIALGLFVLAHIIVQAFGL